MQAASTVCTLHRHVFWVPSTLNVEWWLWLWLWPELDNNLDWIFVTLLLMVNCISCMCHISQLTQVQMLEWLAGPAGVSLDVTDVKMSDSSHHHQQIGENFTQNLPRSCPTTLTEERIPPQNPVHRYCHLVLQLFLEFRSHTIVCKCSNQNCSHDDLDLLRFSPLCIRKQWPDHKVNSECPCKIF